MRVFRRFRRDLQRICRIVEAVRRDGLSFDDRFLELVLALEDKRFMSHPGVDIAASLRAAAHFTLGKARGGASTIDMQLARTLTGYRARTLTRKIYESALAIAAKRRLGRGDILTAYLAIAYFGTGLAGADAASIRLFGRKTGSLAPEESAQVAALLVYPLPREPPPLWHQRVERRARYGLARRALLKSRLGIRPSAGVRRFDVWRRLR